jgi:hypothetical protein
MPVIGKLTTLVTAQTKPFESGMKRAGKASKGFVASINSATGPINNFVKGLTAIGAAGFTVHGIFNSMVAEFDRLENTIDVADKIGESATELSGLREAARLTSVSANTLDMALQRMTRRISEAANGTGEARAALRELGLDAGRLNRIGPAAAFRELADAINKVQNPADRLRLAFKLFDSEGAELVRTLALGSDELARIAQEALAAGKAMDAVEVQRVRDVAEAAKELSGAWSDVKTEITLAAAGLVKFTKEATGADIGGFTSGLRSALLGPASGMARERVAAPRPSGGTAGDHAARAAAEAEKRRTKSLDDAMKAYEASLKKLEALGREADSIRMSVRTPLEAFKDTVRNLIKLREAGALSDETLKRAGVKAAKEFASATRKPSIGAPGSIAATRRGTVADASATRAALKAQQELARTGKETLEETKKHTTLFEDMLTELRKPEPMTVEF